MTPEEWLSRFETVVSVPDSQIDLARAALIIAADEYPDIDIAHYIRRLDEMAEPVRARLDPLAAALEQIALLNEHLFNTLGLRGNREVYYDPRNSYLNDVLDRRLGIPITLSLVYIEIGRRLGCPLSGVAMPGHFVVKWKTDDRVIFIDPFNAGQIIGQFAPTAAPSAEQQAMMARLRWMEPASAKQILVRLLANLHSIHTKTEVYAAALPVVEKILILQPDAPDILRQAGMIAFRASAYRRAATHLRNYLTRFPASPNAEETNTLLRQAEAMLGRLN